MGLGFEGSGVGWGREGGGVSAGSGSRGVWDWLWFSCGAAHGGGGGGVIFCFSGLLCYCWRSFHFGGVPGHWAIILWCSDIFLIFLNFQGYS